jgi:hypothetical protein
MEDFRSRKQIPVEKQELEQVSGKVQVQLDGGGGGRANSRVSLVEQTLVIGECKAEE